MDDSAAPLVVVINRRRERRQKVARTPEGRIADLAYQTALQQGLGMTEAIHVMRAYHRKTKEGIAEIHRRAALKETRNAP